MYHSSHARPNHTDDMVVIEAREVATPYAVGSRFDDSSSTRHPSLLYGVITPADAMSLITNLEHIDLAQLIELQLRAANLVLVNDIHQAREDASH